MWVVVLMTLSFGSSRYSSVREIYAQAIYGDIRTDSYSLGYDNVTKCLRVVNRMNVMERMNNMPYKTFACMRKKEAI